MKRIFFVSFYGIWKKKTIENVKLSFVILSYMFLFYNAFFYILHKTSRKKIFHVLVFMENRFYNSESGPLSFILWMNNTKKSNLLPWVY